MEWSINIYDLIFSFFLMVSSTYSQVFPNKCYLKYKEVYMKPNSNFSTSLISQGKDISAKTADQSEILKVHKLPPEKSVGLCNRLQNYSKKFIHRDL